MPSWRIDELAPGVFARTGAHPLQPNSGIVVGDEGVVVVDSGYSAAAGRELRADVARLTSKPIVAVVISHHHFDHAWGNEVFTDARILGHTNAGRNMVTEPEAYRERMIAYAHEPAAWYDTTPEALAEEMRATHITPPSETFSESATLDVGGMRLELLHLGPGHTDGDTLVYLPESRVLFGGDLICNHVFPNAMDGDPLHWPRVLASAAELDLAIVVPGHGAVGDARTVQEFGACLATITDEVQHALDDGAPDPRAASTRLHLGDFTGWSGPELLPGTVRRVYRTLEAAGRAGTD